MLLSRLSVVFEGASADLELWNRAASTQVDAQLRERRKAFKRRTETLEKVQNAAGELEARIAEIDAHDLRLQELQARVGDLAEALREHAFAAPLATDAALVRADLPLFDDAVPVEAMEQRQA
jgi:DNA repair ATPase RecN